MKTKILVFFIAASLLVSFSFAQARVTATTPEIEALIQSIHQQIQEIKEKIISLQEELVLINPEYKPKFIPEFRTELKEIREEIKFTQNLRKGLRGQEVMDLQEFLSQYPDVYPEGLVTGYFGNLTERAVKRFQKKFAKDILKPWKLTDGTGFVGKGTRDKLNELTLQDKKIIICHYPPGNPDARHTIVISKSALEAHLALGNTVGPCGDESGQEPDPDPDPEPDTTAPADITDFTATAGDTEVELLWVNPIDSDFEKVKIMRKVDAYSTGVTDGDEVYDGDEDNYTDTELINGTLYYYKAFTYDDVPNYSVGAEVSATPLAPEPDTTAPVIANIQVSDITETSATITWETDENSDSIVDYGLTDAYGSTVSGVADVISHEVNLVDLTEETIYHYRVSSTDGADNLAQSDDKTFTTDITSPADATDFTATVGNAEIALSWTNPVDEDFAGIKILRKTDVYPVDATDGDEVYDGTEITYTDIELANGTAYHYMAFTYDEVPNYSTGVEVSATPAE